MLKAERDEAAKKSHTATTGGNFKFRDIPQNDNMSPPAVKSTDIMYKSCIRESWREKNPHLEFKDDTNGDIAVLALADSMDTSKFDRRDAVFWENDADDEFEMDGDEEEPGNSGL